jgi:plastocyanin
MKTKLSLILLIGILLTACRGTSVSTSTTTPPPNQSGEAKVSIANFAFDPVTLSIKTGTTVTWTNNDTVAHNVLSDDGSWGSSSLAKGATFTYTFTQAGTFPYHCGVHPTMKATIIVVGP